MNIAAKPRQASVYEIRHVPTGKRYIGSTQGRTFSRLASHVWHLEIGRHQNHAMQADWHTSHVSDWSFRILESNITPDAKLGREAFWIDKLKPEYNVKRVSPADSRTERIEAVVALRAAGMNYRQIAQATNLSIGTVHNYASRYQPVI